MKVAIVGAGLAGCAAAYFLKRSGADVIVYDAADQAAAGASGNDLGLYSPRFSAFESPESLFYCAAFDLALDVFSDLENEDIDWNPCGVLHLIVDEKKEKQYRQTVRNWAWGADDFRIVDSQEASELAGVDVPYEALYVPRSGSVSPRKLCQALLGGVDVRLGAPVEDLASLDADCVVVANGMGAAQLLDLPLKAVRGQVSKVRGTAESLKLKTHLSYGRYCSAAKDGEHLVGATFQRWLDHSDILPEDDDYNLGKLAEVLPDLAEGLEVVGNRAAVRTTAPDYFPVVGCVRDDLYVSTAHGSHGILSAIGGGKMLAQMIMGESVSVPDESVKALCPSRFKDVKKAE